MGSVLDVLENRSMFSSSGVASAKPKLLVIDEIDGVVGSEGKVCACSHPPEDECVGSYRCFV